MIYVEVAQLDQQIQLVWINENRIIVLCFLTSAGIFLFKRFNIFTNRENVLNWGSGVFVDIRCIEPAESPKHRHWDVEDTSKDNIAPLFATYQYKKTCTLCNYRSPFLHIWHITFTWYKHVTDGCTLA